TSAQMAGDMKTAIAEAKRLRTVLDPATSARIGWIQAIDAAPFLAMAQFASPEAILAMPAPDTRLPYAAAMRHYARAVAFAQRQDGAGFDRRWRRWIHCDNLPLLPIWFLKECPCPTSSRWRKQSRADVSLSRSISMVRQSTTTVPPSLSRVRYRIR